MASFDKKVKTRTQRCINQLLGLRKECPSEHLYKLSHAIRIMREAEAQIDAVMHGYLPSESPVDMDRQAPAIPKPVAKAVTPPPVQAPADDEVDESEVLPAVMTDAQFVYYSERGDRGWAPREAVQKLKEDAEAWAAMDDSERKACIKELERQLILADNTKF